MPENQPDATPDRKRLIGYWIVTALICLPMTMGGIMDLIQTEDALEIMRQLGYPDYFMVLLGVAKVLGVIALLAPGLRRVKEWAYAGFAFDLIGAVVSHVSVGDPIVNSVMPMGLLVVLVASHQLRPASRRLLD